MLQLTSAGVLQLFGCWGDPVFGCWDALGDGTLAWLWLVSVGMLQRGAGMLQLGAGMLHLGAGMLQLGAGMLTVCAAGFLPLPSQHLGRQCHPHL